MNQLQQCIKYHISDRASFTSGTQRWLNIDKLVNIIEHKLGNNSHTHHHHHTHKSAFDKIQCPFMRKVWKKLNTEGLNLNIIYNKVYTTQMHSQHHPE